MPATVLLVDRDPAFLQAQATSLGAQTFSLVCATSSEQALDILETHCVDLIVAESGLPTRGKDALLTSVALNHPETVRISLDASDAAMRSLRCLERGVYRCLSKPLDAIELAETIQDALAFRRRLAARELWDPHSNLPNERALIEYLNRCRSHDGQDLPQALFLFGVDRLRDLNEFLDQGSQESIFEAIASRLVEASEHSRDLVPMSVDIDAYAPHPQAGLKGRSTFVARPGFNEFAVVFEPAAHFDAPSVAQSLLRAMDDALTLVKESMVLTSRCGVVSQVAAHASPQAALAAARTALAEARARSSSRRVAVFDDLLNRSYAVRASVESDFQDAVESGLLEVFYQPIVDAASVDIVGTEALLRWHHPRCGWMHPRRIVRLAEERALIHRLTMQTLGVACRQQVAWRERGCSVIMSVNVTASEVVHARFVDHVLEIIERSGLDAGCLQIEVNESIVDEDADSALRALDALRAAGAKTALDDFGTGRSSLSALQRIQPDMLKLDRTFVAAARNQPESACVLEGVVRIAHGLGIQVTAEGVEGEADQRYLTDLAVDRLQGYLFSRPVRPAELEPFILSSRA